MQFLIQVKENLKNTKNSFQRFPIPMVAIIASAFCMIGALHWDENIKVSLRFQQLGWTLVFSFFAILFVRLFISSFQEKSHKSFTFRVVIYFFVAISVIGIYLLLSPKEVESIFQFERKYIYLGVLFSLAVGCTFIGKITRWENYVIYVIKIFSAYLVAIIYCTVLYAGISSVLFAIDHLLGISISYKAYMYIAILIFGPIQAGIFLSNYPKADDKFLNYEVSKVFRVLLLYIVTPILIVYAVILYLYFGKLLMTKTLPSISYLVLWFGMISTGTIFFLTQLKQESIAKFMVRYFPIAILPLVGMLFYAMFLRIKEYGMTENRYYVLAMGVWITLSMLYFLWKRGRDSIAIVILLSLLLFASSVGPVSAYSISRSNQIARLEKVLLKNSMLQGKKIVKNENISEEDKETISSILYYLTTEHQAKEVPFLPEAFIMEEMKENFGFEEQMEEFKENPYNYYYDSTLPLEIKGYDRMVKIDYSSLSDTEVIGAYNVVKEGKNLLILKNMEGTDNAFGEVVLAKINMEDVRAKLVALKKANLTINSEDLSVVGEQEGIKFKILFTDIQFYEGAEGVEDYFISFYLMVQDKPFVGRVDNLES